MLRPVTIRHNWPGFLPESASCPSRKANAPLFPNSNAEATKRLNYIRVRLLKAMFGNNFRRRRAEIIFLTFKRGSREGFNQRRASSPTLHK